MDVVHARRLSGKRAWDEVDALPPLNSASHATVLPPIDVVPYQRPDTPRAENPGVGNKVDGVVKKARYAGEGYNVFRLEEMVVESKRTRSTRSPSLAHQKNQNVTRMPSMERWGRTPDAGKAAESLDTANLCIRCKRSTTQDIDAFHSLDENCEHCRRNPELAWVTQAAAAGLTQLAETLSSGMSSQRRGIIRGPEQRRVGSADCPPIAQFGLNQTLNWILGRIHHVNALADHFVKSLPADIVAFNLEKGTGVFGNSVNDAPLDANEIMKRRPSSDVLRTDDLADPHSDARLFSRRRSSGTTNSGEELPPMRVQPDYGSLVSPGLPGQRPSIMNPPPAPNRQLPSPPSRSLPSPTSLENSSPSHRSYGNFPHINLPTLTQYHPFNTTYLPSISTAPSLSSSISPDDPATAIRDHTVALQHEVSLQKLALSSLQSEHDKLLAAFSRSRTRASALEKKHAVSDTEIITLTEDKLRLQTQVQEMEREVEELAKARDHAREVAVREGVQYVEIVRRASVLEERGRLERERWEILKREFEGRIEALTRKCGPDSINVFSSGLVVGRDDIDTPVSSLSADQRQQEPLPSLDEDVKVKDQAAAQPDVNTKIPESYSAATTTQSKNDLRGEIQLLRKRCEEVEDVLRRVRDEGREMEELIEKMRGKGRGIGECVEAFFGEGPS